jgi:hypothetical protein
MLVCDAWFDTLSANDSAERLFAVALALGVELPTAAICLLIAQACGRGRKARATLRARHAAAAASPTQRPPLTSSFDQITDRHPSLAQ